MNSQTSNHTGNELQLMLEDKKPLSMFYDDADVRAPDCVIPEDEFDTFVALGTFSKAERAFNLAFDPRVGRHLRVRYVLYCIKGQEWRMEAMFLAIKTSMVIGKYDEGIDRIKGSLLGYTDEQINAYVASRKRSFEC